MSIFDWADSITEGELSAEVELVRAEEARWEAVCQKVGEAFYESEWMDAHDRATGEAAIRGFVHHVATQCAFNGADDKGQQFYDESLNPWLSEKAEQFIRDGLRSEE